MPFAELYGIRPGSEIVATGRVARVPVGQGLLGRIVDALGTPLDNLPPIKPDNFRSLYTEPGNPIQRQRISRVFETRIRAIDTLLTIGEGQRLGIFAGSGVGKSSLLGMIAQNSQADINVIALIGERGREVRDFVEVHLGDALKRSVVIVATAEQSALLRSHAAFAATAIAEHFRDQGLSVALMLDSLTRFAMARREIGLSVGEPPTARGYTPSVFGILPRLLERSGPGPLGSGSITALYTVLVEGDDFNEPVSDHVRAIVDGHFVLSRDIANRGRYPSLDILQSISRLFSQLASKDERRQVEELIELIATYEESRDLIGLGAYKAGANKLLDRAVRLIPKVESFLRQALDEVTSRRDAYAALQRILRDEGP
jgi:flagellum-specific ATP synthase